MRYGERRRLLKIIYTLKYNVWRGEVVPGNCVDRMVVVLLKCEGTKDGWTELQL